MLFFSLSKHITLFWCKINCNVPTKFWYISVKHFSYYAKICTKLSVKVAQKFKREKYGFARFFFFKENFIYPEMHCVIANHKIPTANIFEMEDNE